MKKYTFEIVFTDDDLGEDEFTEEVFEKDESGLPVLTETLVTIIRDNLFPSMSEDEVRNIVKLKSYESK